MDEDFAESLKDYLASTNKDLSIARESELGKPN
jgi:hypothetical protein